MKGLYSAPLRVYLLLFCLALAGIYAGLGLPVSLFPNSSKPTITVRASYGSNTAEEFLHTYGESLEGELKAISTNELRVEQVRATYDRNSVEYDVEFEWGSPSLEAFREVSSAVHGYAARFPSEIRNSVNIWSNSSNSGFMAVSFYSESRSLDDIYDVLDPLLAPELAKIRDADQPGLWNPSHKDVQIEINPGRMASLQILPRDISKALEAGLYGANGGSLAAEAQTYSIQMPRPLQSLDDIGRLPIRAGSGTVIHLGDIARVDFATNSDGGQSFRTNGAPSIILWAQPKAGGNVKKMSEEILAVIDHARPNIPADIQYKVLVDPSEFIRSAIHNVMREVLIGGLMAVAILFLFIGSLRNTATAAIEIPLSMVLAFIPMKLMGMNLNLISLGGLALSAGMNVDASVVVMENIFRHFHEFEEVRGPLSYAERLDILVRSVKEVRFAVIASTIASLVVFIPLAFTSQLSNAILGDLAKTVVFSHGFSAFVALILVPTVRLQLMSSKEGPARMGAPKELPKERHDKSPIEGAIRWLEEGYGRALAVFLDRPKLRSRTYAGLALTLALLLIFVLPRLPREVIGKPDTDWITIRLNASGNTLFRQMEAQSGEFEAALLKDFGSHIQYTFTQVYQANGASVMARLKNKGEMREVWKAIETRFPNTPMVRFRVDSWNPAELPIPDPPQLQVSVQGGDLTERAETAQELNMLFQEKKILPRIWTEPDVSHTDTIVLRPNLDHWAVLDATQLSSLTPADLADLVRVATAGKPASIDLPIKGKNATVYLRYPPGYAQTPEDIGALPVGAGGKLMPLRALVSVSLETAKPTIYRENGREVFHIIGRSYSSSEGRSTDQSFLDRAKEAVRTWQVKGNAKSTLSKPIIVFDEADKDLNEALHQLIFAVGLSILLIFVTLVIQFGSMMNALLVLVAIPLGLIGVLVSLFVFRSTLSLNSVLGVILLNGIAVANSIILVDFQKRLVDRGSTPREAAVEAGRKRLRPILITSLTSILAMLPIAFGVGEGGRILQPLGIAVSGGLWVSMGFTLFVVPALQVSFQEYKNREVKGSGLKRAPMAVPALLLLLVFLLSAPFALFAPCARADVGSGAVGEAPLSFAPALSQILARSTQVSVQEQGYLSLRAANEPARLFLLPTLSTDLKETLTQYPQGFGLQRAEQAELVTNLNVFRFGADYALLQAAEGDEAQQQSLVRSAVIQIEDQGVRALIGVIQRRREIDVYQRQIKLREESLQIADERFRRGLLAEQEVRKVRVDLSNARARLVEGQFLSFDAEASLQDLLGRTDIEQSWPWQRNLGAMDIVAFVEGRKFDVLARPDWSAAKSRVDAEQNRTLRNYRLMLPSFDVSVNAGYYRYDYVGAGNPNGLSWIGTFGVTFPLFDHLVNLSNARAESHILRQAEIQKTEVERAAPATFASARQSLVAAVLSARERESTLIESRGLYADSLRRFQSGRSDSNELLIDQGRLLDSELLEVAGWAEAHVALARFCHELGKTLSDCQ